MAGHSCLHAAQGCGTAAGRQLLRPVPGVGEGPKALQDPDG